MSTQPENEVAEIEEIFRLNELEKSWRRSSLKPNDSIWLETFPEATEIVPLKISEWKEIAHSLANEIKENLTKLNEIARDDFSYWFFRQCLKADIGASLDDAKNHILRLGRLICKKPTRGLLSEGQIEEAKLMPIQEIVDIKLRQVGQNYTGLCPFHEERHPSFYIYSDNNTFICYGCQAKGDAISYVMKVKNLNFKEAVLWLLKGSR